MNTRMDANEREYSQIIAAVNCKFAAFFISDYSRSFASIRVLMNHRRPGRLNIRKKFKD
jgi:hypothetical protein